MHKILCCSLIVLFTGCSSPNKTMPLNVTHIENNKAHIEPAYPNLEELPAWVLSGLTQQQSDIAVHCSYPDSFRHDVLLKSKDNAVILAKASLIKKIGSSEVVYSKEELKDESYKIEVKSRSSGYLPNITMLQSQVFKYKNRLHSCVAIGFQDMF